MTSTNSHTRSSKTKVETSKTSKGHRHTLLPYIARLVERLRLEGRTSMVDRYRSIHNSLSRFLASKGMADISFDSLTASVVADYEASLRSRGLVPNTTSFYMRNLRAIFNKAVDEGLVDQTHPFDRVYTGVDRTAKRAIPLADIRQLMALNLSDNPAIDYARDIFMLSFYLRGMSIVDMAMLLKSDLKGSTLTYRRRKTGQRLSIQWTDEMQHIVDKHPSSPASPYLLPIVKSVDVNPRYAYRNAASRINANLKKLASIAGLQTPTLTTYVARHSWASAAHALSIPLSVISEGMGHDSERTTQIYLASLDTSIVDRANQTIIDALTES